MKKILIFFACIILLSACSGGKLKGSYSEQNSFEFFTEYRSWNKINKDTIIREEEARELYVNTTAMQSASSRIFAQGSVLVKEQYHLTDLGGGSFAKGELFQISVMRKTGIGEFGGWDFRAFEPRTGKEITGINEGCAICHTKRKSFDYTFSSF